MARGGRELFPPDRGLQVRLAIASLVGLVLTVALVGGLAWLAIFSELYPFVFFVALFALGGIPTARHTRAGDPSDERGKERVRHAAKRVEGHVQRLASLADLEPPRVEIDSRDVPQCWTTSGLIRGPRLVATVGLVERLSDDELGAVVAHELSHVANGDARVMTLVGGPSTWIMRGIRHMWAEGKDDWRMYLAVTLYGSYSSVLAVPGLLTARIVSRHRELAADRGSAVLTGSPAALASALRRLSGELDRIPKRDLRALGGGNLFYVLPTREPRGLRRLWATHPRLDRRIERLEEMERRLQAARPVLGSDY